MSGFGVLIEAECFNLLVFKFVSLKFEFKGTFCKL